MTTNTLAKVFLSLVLMIGCTTVATSERTVSSSDDDGKDACKMIRINEKDEQAKYIGGLICGVLYQSYSDLTSIIIDVGAIEDQPMLNKFSDGKLSFISFFNPNKFMPFRKDGYIIGYSRDKIFNPDKTLPEFTIDNLKAVIAHELAHTVIWRSLPALSDVGYATYTAMESNRAHFERQVDVVAIKRGIISGYLYAEELGNYRTVNEARTEPQKRSYLRKMYYFGEQLKLIEDAGLSYTDKKQRDLFFIKFYKDVPQSVESVKTKIKLIAQEIKDGK